MYTLFYVDKSYPSDNRNQIVFEGKKENSCVSPGMLMEVPFEDGVSILIEIEKVENVGNEFNDAKLYAKCPDEDKMNFLMSLNIKDEVFKVIDQADKSKSDHTHLTIENF